MGGGPGLTGMAALEETAESLLTCSLSLREHTWRKGHLTTGEQVAIYKPGGESQPETTSAGTLILDFQPLDL